MNVAFLERFLAALVTRPQMKSCKSHTPYLNASCFTDVPFSRADIFLVF